MVNAGYTSFLHVTRQPCWMTIQYNYFLRNLHGNRVKVREARNAFVLVIQHGRRDVMNKPANQQYDANRPLPSSKNPLFQNEARCTTFLVKKSFICMRMKNHFHIKGRARNLVLIQRPGGTRKWLVCLKPV